MDLITIRTLNTIVLAESESTKEGSKKKLTNNYNNRRISAIVITQCTFRI